MILLHCLQNRFFQFSLALLDMLSACGSLDRNAVVNLGTNYRLETMETEIILSALKDNEFLQLAPAEGNWIRCQACENTHIRFPAGTHERSYLQYILRLPEASLFLENELREKLLQEGLDPFSQIRRLLPQNSKDTDALRPEDFRTVLQAIDEGRMICYRYRTKGSQGYIHTSCVPWKLEHSVYDCRWWVILYDPAADRTIKAVLSNLRNVQLGDKHSIPQEQILAAMEKLKHPEPVRLIIKDERNALERCFLSFENREVLESRDLGDQRYVLAFSYYRFDTEEILRKLLYLGPAVTLVGPESLKEMLRSRIMQALEQQRES